MKKLVMLVILIIFSNFVYAEEINIPETFTAETSVNEVTTYYYAGDKLLADENNKVITYHYQDRLGSDVNSKTLPFGQEIINGERFSFTGKELDDELYYFNARYYDSELGRFTSVDPVQENHPYSYVANNPMNYVDITGMSKDWYLNKFVESAKKMVTEWEYMNSVSDYFGVKMSSVYVAADSVQNIEELPVVFFIAKERNQDPKFVIEQHNSGKSWHQILFEDNIKSKVEILNPNLRGFVLSSVFQPSLDKFGEIHRFSGLTIISQLIIDDFDRKEIKFNDKEINNLINLRLISKYYDTNAYKIMALRDKGQRYDILAMQFSLNKQ